MPSAEEIGEGRRTCVVQNRGTAATSEVSDHSGTRIVPVKTNTFSWCFEDTLWEKGLFHKSESTSIDQERLFEICRLCRPSIFK